MAIMACSIDGCERNVLARGWCGTHYARWRKTGRLETTRFDKRPCSVDDCPNFSAKRGWCETHYSRWKLTGDVRENEPVAKAKSPIVNGRKQCGKCSEWLPLSNFNSHQHGTGGVESRCRECQRVSSAAYRAANPTYWQEWQKDNAQIVRDISNRRRAAKMSRQYEKIDRAIVFERDGYNCKLCGLALEMSAKFPHPLSPTLDHIIPINKGGHHLYANLQAAHFRCNTVKGDRAD